MMVSTLYSYTKFVYVKIIVLIFKYAYVYFIVWLVKKLCESL